jgi:hypothetical protein
MNVSAIRILLACTLALGLAIAPRQAGAAPTPVPGNPCATQPGSFKLLVDRPGIYEVTPADLQATGWSGPIDLSRLHLYRGACVAANEVALDLGGKPGSLLFYGEPSPSRYTATAVYWLRAESNQSLAMPARSVVPAGAPIRSTAVVTTEGTTAGAPRYDTVHPGDDGDHFFQADLRAGSTLPVTFTLASPSTGGAVLRLRLQGLTDGLHRVNLRFAGTDLGVQTWSGATTFTAEIALGPGPLAAGPHLLALSIAAGPIDAVLLDGAALRYPAPLVATAGQTIFDGVAGAQRYTVDGFSAPTALLYDVRDLRRPARLEGAQASGATITWQDAPSQAARYALLTPGQTLRPAIVADNPSNLAQGSADYLIVGYGPFLPALAPLAAYYRSQGLRVVTIDIQDTYDEFNGGELHPEALRSFLRYAYASWARPAPTYVLLVGDGTYDFRDRLGLGWASFVPPYLADVDPWMIEAACDTCYGRVQTDDPRDQPLPDLLVGRLPVRSAEQASIVVAKTLTYLTAAPHGGWQATTLFLADNYLDENGQPDQAGDFAAMAQSAIAALPPGITVQRFFYDPSPSGQGQFAHYSDPSALRAAFFRAFDAGAALVTYVGHANYWQWAFTVPNASLPYLWYLYDADGRSNGDRLPILLSMSCLTGFFHEPVLPTTDERLLTHPGGGIVASLSPAGLGVAHGHDVFSHAVIRALYSADPAARTLGAAQRTGFQAVLAGRCCADLAFTYAILGDPALRLSFVPTSATFLPIVGR